MKTTPLTACLLVAVALLLCSPTAASNDHLDTVLGSLQQDVNITCSLRSQNLIWTREQSGNFQGRKIITPGHKYALHKCPGCLSRLQINSLTEDDEGIYACYVTGQEPKKFRVKLIVPIAGLALTAGDENEDSDGIFGVADETLIVSCSVTKSRPKPLLSVHTEMDSKRPGKTRFEQMPEYYKSQPQSDGSFITQSRFKTERLRKEDDLSDIVCEAVLPGLNRRLHASRIARPLRVHYPPECSTSTHPVLVALNRTNSIKCPVLRAYPSVTTYKWSTGQLQLDAADDREFVQLRPRSLSEIHDVACFADNGVGAPVKCTVRLALGAKPDPVTDCTWSYVNNHSLQIGCKLGFDQGDPYQQCVLYREDPSSGLMTEYARARKCSFVIDPTDQSEKHKLQVFSLNKFGDSLQQAFTININNGDAEADSRSSRRRRLRLSIVVLVAGVFGVTLLLCCWYGNSGGSQMTPSSKTRRKDRYLQEKEQARYRRPIRNARQSDTRRLLPQVNDCSIIENGNAQDSSTVSSYLPAVDQNGHAMIHCPAETPPPVSARKSIPFGDDRRREMYGVEVLLDTDQISSLAPEPTPRHSLPKKRAAPNAANGNRRDGRNVVTDC